MVTQERLKELLHYDPETGVFIRKVATSNVLAGGVAGASVRGYLRISIDNRIYSAHRLAYFYVFGEFPQGRLDHRDRNKSNNRITNLRTVTQKQNLENTGIPINNKSGFKGVSWYKRDSNWSAQIHHCGKKIHIGYFKTPEEASAAYEAMRDKLFTHHKKAA